MYINCKTRKVLITPSAILNMKRYKLGTEKFFKSVRKVNIYYEPYHRMSDSGDFLISEINMDCEQSLGLVNKYFTELKCLKLLTNLRN